MTASGHTLPAGVRQDRYVGVIGAFVRRDFALAWSYRLPFFMGLGQSLVTVVFLYFLGRLVGSRIARVAGGLHVSYFGFVVLGTSIMALFSVSLTAFAQRLRTDQTTGTLEVLFTMPVRPVVTVLASAVYQITYALGVAAMTVAAAVGLGMRFDTSPGGVVVALTGLVATLGLFCAAGVAFAAFVVVFKKGETVTSMAAGVLTLLGGVYFPVAIMPGPLRSIAQILPFTWALDVVRNALLANEIPLVRLGELWISAAILLPVTLLVFSASVRRSRRFGTLGQY